jgi:hypothetical protein
VTLKWKPILMADLGFETIAAKAAAAAGSQFNIPTRQEKM